MQTDAESTDDWIPPDADDAVDRLRAALTDPPRWSDRLRDRLGLPGPPATPDDRPAAPAVPTAAGLAGALAAIGLLVGVVAGWIGRGVVAPPGPSRPVPEASASGSTSPDVAAPGSSRPGDPVAEPVAEPVAAPVGPSVHVAGAVVAPGLYRLADAARVADAVAAAGGLAQDADGDRLNLAAPLADGQRLFVPRIGAPDAPEPVAPSGVGLGPDAAPEAGDGVSDAPIDINRAGATELEALPGIGPTLAGAIVEHRTRHGPFRSVEGLLDVSGIGAARLEQLRDLVAVG